MAAVKKMTTDSEITETLSLMKQLRPHPNRWRGVSIYTLMTW
jgi:hypothetical protein